MTFLPALRNMIGIAVISCVMVMPVRGETRVGSDLLISSETPEPNGRLDRSHDLTPSTYSRWTNAGNRVNWNSKIGWLNRRPPRIAVHFDIGVYGFTDPGLSVKEYVARYRFGRDTTQPWLFHEIEPEVSWPSDNGDYRQRELAFTFRLEIPFPHQ